MIKNRREIVQFSFCPFYRSAILVQRHGSALLNANNTVFEQDMYWKYAVVLWAG